MNPIYKEYIEFLESNNSGIKNENLKEGFYWLDKQIVKAYNTDGELVKVLRIFVDEELNITYKRYDNNKKNNYEKIERWIDTANRREGKLNDLELNSINLIRSKLLDYKNYNPIILTSGGKDSVLVTHLVRKVDKNICTMFNNTSLDCADTYLYIKRQDNMIITNPKQGFYQWLGENFIPTRLSRACCTLFKEGEMISYLDDNSKYLFFMGGKKSRICFKIGILR